MNCSRPALKSDGKTVTTHPNSEWICGPRIAHATDRTPSVIYGQFACVDCGHVQNWAKPLNPAHNRTTQLSEAEELKPVSKHRRTRVWTPLEWRAFLTTLPSGT